MADASPKDLAPILKMIRTHTDFLLSAHVRVDGDAVGSELALYHALRELGKRPHIVNSELCPEDLSFLPGSSVVEAGPEALKTQYDAMIALDATDLERCEAIHEHLPRPLPIINIDHHASNSQFGDYNWVDPTAAAVGEQMFDLINALEVDITEQIAIPLYVAIATDTGRFSFSNTTEKTHQIAAELVQRGVNPGEISGHLYRGRSLGEMKLLGAVIDGIEMDGDLAWSWLEDDKVDTGDYEVTETQPFVEAIKAIRGVEVALLFRTLQDDGRIKVSLRSESQVDCSALAAEFGGGGHPRASGISTSEDRETFVPRLLDRARAYLSEATASEPVS